MNRGNAVFLFLDGAVPNLSQKLGLMAQKVEHE